MQVGGGGGVEFLTENKISTKKCSWSLKTQKKIGGGGGEFFFPTNFFFSKMFLGF